LVSQLSEENRSRVLDNRMLRRIFVRNRDKVTGGWRRLQNKELHSLNSSSPNIIRVIKSRRMKWGHVAPIGVMRNACKMLVGKPEGKRQLGRPKCRWEDNIKIHLEEIRDMCGLYLSD
jgi:hypothetical protein